MSDLSAPLTRRKTRRAKEAAARPPFRLPITRIAVGATMTLLVGAVGWATFVKDPLGGRPQAVVDINTAPSDNAVADLVATGPATITADPELLPAAPALEAAEASLLDLGAIDPNLLEESEFGALPRMSASGARPFDTYARSVDPAMVDNRPRLAIVVSGLGLNRNGTMEAIRQLPEAVSLGFAPYGKSLKETVGIARTEGHEAFLEVPLEPFDYPESDPGPDTLVTGQAPRENLNRLFRVLGKFQGYAGLINNMGARFTASGTDFGPMMEEIGARGLGYLDDGSSNRSLAPQLAQANRVPFGKADLTLDLNPGRVQIIEQLTRLEDRARDTGSAIGIASALPISIQTIAEWAKTLEQRGVVLVPASNLMRN